METLKKGFLPVLISVACWAVGGNVASFLFTSRQMTPEHVTVFRLLGAGILLLLIQYRKEGWQMTYILRTRNDVVRLLLFGVLGILWMQYFFYATIAESNAPTATILQYFGPLIIVMVTSFWARQFPPPRVFISLALIMSGAFLLVTHGRLETLDISTKALVFGGLSAIGCALYNLLPIPLLLRYETKTVAGWGMIPAGVLLLLITRPWRVPFLFDVWTGAALVFLIVFGTVLPFSLYMEGCKVLGVSRASITSTAEPLLSTVVAVLFLGQVFYPIDYLGVLLVIVSVVLLGLPNRKVKPLQIDVSDEE